MVGFRSFADVPVIPLNISYFAKLMIRSYLPKLHESLAKMNVSKTNFDLIQKQFDNLSETSESLLIGTERFQKAIDSAKTPKELEAVNDRLISFERCFINPRGVSNINPSARHVLFSASDLDNYSNSLMAGIQNAVSQKLQNPLEHVNF